jgi:hypothetical protein
VTGLVEKTAAPLSQPHTEDARDFIDEYLFHIAPLEDSTVIVHSDDAGEIIDNCGQRTVS